MNTNSTQKPEPGQTVFVVEDDLSVSEALFDLFEQVGISARFYSSAEEFLASSRQNLAGCLVLDVRLPGLSGVELQSRLIKSHMDIPVIVMSAYGDVPMVRRVFRTGAIEFLSKPFQDADLLRAIEQGFAIDRERRATARETAEIRARIATLKPRELEVIELVVKGMTNPQIAVLLDLKLVTIKLYRSLAIEKMQATSLADLVRMWEKK
jgi:FixJ family two-component response regulator